MIDEGTKIFRIYKLAVWRSIQTFYSHFTKVTRKCGCFGHSVEPCKYAEISAYNIHSNIQGRQDCNPQLEPKLTWQTKMPLIEQNVNAYT